METLRLTNIGARGVNTASDPLHIDPSELSSAQNAEYGFDGAVDALKKRPGMTVINAQDPVGGDVPVSIDRVFNIPFTREQDKIKVLYAAYASGSAHKWSRSLDGNTWFDVDTPTSPFPVIASVGYWVNRPKCVSIGNKMYFVGADFHVHEWDGTTDRDVANFPPGQVTGSFSTPGAPTVTPSLSSAHYVTVLGVGVTKNPNFGGAPTIYTYQVVTVYASGNSAGSTPVSITTGSPTLGPTFPTQGRNTITHNGLGGASGPADFVRYDYYRTFDGSGLYGTGKIGSSLFAQPSFADTGQIGDSASVPAQAPAFATSYSYKLVALTGANYSAASANGSTTLQTSSLTSTFYNSVIPQAPPVAGATSYDVYRTVGGATQGKVGNIPIVDGNYSTGNGSNLGTNVIFTDGGLTGDGSTAPVAPSGTTGFINPTSVLDTITDGDFLYFAVMDTTSGSPNLMGRILQLNVTTSEWTELTKYYSTGAATASTNSAAALAFYNGGLVYGEYNGTASGATPRIATVSIPNPLAGIWTSFTLAASRSISPSMVVFQGDLFYGTISITATGSAVRRFTEGSGDASSLVSSGAGATGAGNGFTMLEVFDGRLYAGWISGNGGQVATVWSFDGTAWILEYTLAASEVPCQMQKLGNYLYLVTGDVTSGSIFSCGSRIHRRASLQSWGVVNDPSPQLRGALGAILLTSADQF